LVVLKLYNVGLSNSYDHDRPRKGATHPSQV
jgi:hypothetical protein